MVGKNVFGHVGKFLGRHGNPVAGFRMFFYNLPLIFCQASSFEQYFFRNINFTSIKIMSMAGPEAKSGFKHWTRSKNLRLVSKKEKLD
jgi:hypothetical protein